MIWISYEKLSRGDCCGLCVKNCVCEVFYKDHSSCLDPAIKTWSSRVTLLSNKLNFCLIFFTPDKCIHVKSSAKVPYLFLIWWWCLRKYNLYWTQNSVYTTRWTIQALFTMLDFNNLVLSLLSTKKQTHAWCSMKAIVWNKNNK